MYKQKETVVRFSHPLLETVDLSAVFLYPYLYGTQTRFEKISDSLLYIQFLSIKA